MIEWTTRRNKGKQYRKRRSSDMQSNVTAHRREVKVVEVVVRAGSWGGGGGGVGKVGG